MHDNIKMILKQKGQTAEEVLMPPKNIRAPKAGEEKQPGAPFAYGKCQFLKISGEAVAD